MSRRESFLTNRNRPLPSYSTLPDSCNESLQFKPIESGSPLFIVLCLPRMAVPVNLDDQHQFRAIKVYDVFVPGLLPSELQDRRIAYSARPRTTVSSQQVSGFSDISRAFSTSVDCKEYNPLAPLSGVLDVRLDLDGRHIVKDHLILFHCPLVEHLGGDVLGGDVDALGAGLVQHVGKQPHLELKAQNVHAGDVLLAAFQDDLFHEQARHRQVDRAPPPPAARPFCRGRW